MLNDLKELIAINSIHDVPSKHAPFGKSNREVLDKFLSIAENYGLNVGDDNGYAGWAEYGESGPLIGMLGHLDIVPAGDGWSSDPFKLTAENGKIYGRGVSDDKGPVIACLHALKRLKEENADLGCRVRLIVGCNEESGSECIKHYVKHCEVPVASFTPDSDFPVVASEKGIAHLTITMPSSPALADSFYEIGGGTRANIVPNLARAVIKPNSAVMDSLSKHHAVSDVLRDAKVAERLATDGCALSDFAFELNSELTISASGTAAHGSLPQKGDNAIRKILSLLTALTGDENIAAANEYLASPYAVSRLGIDSCDETGALTLNLGICKMKGDVLELMVDVRLPRTADISNVISAISDKMPEGTKVKICHHSEALFFPEDDRLITSLLEVYRQTTGDRKSMPLHIGGGTYAKELPNCVGFGAVFPGEETHMHEPDECYPIEELYKITEIYYHAIKALCMLYS